MIHLIPNYTTINPSLTHQSLALFLFKRQFKFINKFNFQYSDLTDTEDVTMSNLLLKHKNCYAAHKSDVGKSAAPFRIRLKPNAQLLTQRPSKVHIHYREKLNNLIKELRNITLSNKLALLLKTNLTMVQLI